MADSKKVKNEIFIDYCNEYDALLLTINRENLSDEELIQNSLFSFVLQWCAPMEWVYKAAEAIEAREIPAPYAECMGLYLFPFNDPENDFHSDNRFLISRERYLELLRYADACEMQYLEWHYVMQLYALQWVKDEIGGSVYEELVRLPVSEKAEFMRNNYRIIAQPNHKEWTSKKVRIARKILSSSD